VRLSTGGSDRFVLGSDRATVSPERAGATMRHRGFALNASLVRQQTIRGVPTSFLIVRLWFVGLLFMANPPRSWLRSGLSEVTVHEAGGPLAEAQAIISGKIERKKSRDFGCVRGRQSF
jgi:hypothetical protein